MVICVRLHVTCSRGTKPTDFKCCILIHYILAILFDAQLGYTIRLYMYMYREEIKSENHIFFIPLISFVWKTPAEHIDWKLPIFVK